MIELVKQLETGCKIADIARKMGMSRQTIYNYKAKHGGMEVLHMREFTRLRDENVRLRKLIVDLRLQDGIKVEDVAHELGVSRQTIYYYKAKYGGINVRETREVTSLRDENMSLGSLVAGLKLEEELHLHVQETTEAAHVSSGNRSSI